MNGYPKITDAGRLVLAALAAALWLSTAPPAAAATPLDDLAEARTSVGRALDAARAGDLVAARREYLSFENRWFDIEEGIQASSPESYRAIEKRMSEVRLALAEAKPTADAVAEVLKALDAEQQLFVGPRPRPSLQSPALHAGSGKPQVGLALLAIPLGAGLVLAVLRHRRHNPQLRKETSDS